MIRIATPTLGKREKITSSFLAPYLFTLPILIAFFLPIFVFGQSFSEKLFQTYEKYKETSIAERRFNHADIVPLVQSLSAPFIVSEVGKSLEGRSINLIKIGTGKTKVLLWSQMHGDESTATMAILDIFNFLGKNDEFDAERKAMLSDLTLYFIPMLNPDGAEKFKRRTALNIDLNRDALRLQSPEGQILKNIRDKIEADWGFNLHDQSRYYSVGTSDKTATISFLAPTFNYAKDVNEIRKRAIQQIGLMNETLQQYIPGHVAKYNDTFEPRAFGDNIQKWGTSTILIESGGYKNDPEKQFIRKMNYVVLLSALRQIGSKEYENKSVIGYEEIPFNTRYFHELLIRKVTIIKNGQPYILDIGFKQNEIQYDNNRSFYYQRYISDVGDLSTYHGYETFNADGFTLIPGKVYPKTLKNHKKVRKLSLEKLHKEGYTTVKIKKLKAEDRNVNIPLQLIISSSNYKTKLSLGNNPSFFLAKNGVKEYIVINGQLKKL